MQFIEIKHIKSINTLKETGKYFICRLAYLNNLTLFKITESSGLITESLGIDNFEAIFE